MERMRSVSKLKCTPKSSCLSQTADLWLSDKENRLYVAKIVTCKYLCVFKLHSYF